MHSNRAINVEYSSSSSQDSKPRRSPPPLVSVHDASRRASLVGLQRLVYNSQIFSVRSSETSPPPFSDAEADNDATPDAGRVSSPRPHSHQSVPTKPKRSRTSFTPAQLERLEEDFCVDMYVVGLKRMKLANELDLSERQVKVWFQNRRMKYKRERSKLCGGANK